MSEPATPSGRDRTEAVLAPASQTSLAHDLNVFEGNPIWVGLDNQPQALFSSAYNGTYVRFDMRTQATTQSRGSGAFGRTSNTTYFFRLANRDSVGRPASSGIGSGTWDLGAAWRDHQDDWSMLCDSE